MKNFSCIITFRQKNRKDHDESSNNLTFIMVFYLFEVIPHRPKNRSYCFSWQSEAENFHRQAASNQYLR